MRRLLPILSVLLVLGVFAADADADFGLTRFETSFVAADGSPVTQAGSHPYAMDTRLRLATHEDEGAGAVSGQELRTLQIELPVGFVGNVTAAPQCSLVAFKTKEERPGHESATMCPDSAAVGNAGAVLFGATSAESAAVAPVYNLEPPPGAVAALGFRFALVPIIVELRIDPSSPNDVIATVRNVSQAGLVESFIELWGEPGDSSHDPYRGHCLNLNSSLELGQFASSGVCSGSSTGPFLTLPRSCAGPSTTSYVATSWQGAVADGSFAMPSPTGCDRLGFTPSISATPSSRATDSSTGLDFGLQVETPGLTSAGALAQTDIKNVAVTLPEGFAVNPSLAEGLAACSEEQLAREVPEGAAGSGCPEAATIGTVEVETPLLGKTLDGTIYAATPYLNGAGNALLAAYVVIKDPELGVLITQPVKIAPDPTTGRIVATSESLPQLPFSHFRLRFRSGERGPLTTPSTCGTYRTEAVLDPWSGGPSIATGSVVEVVTGPGGGSCPSGAPGFAPSFEAGTVSPIAGAYTPFALELDRAPGSARLRSLETTLPAGALAKLKGVSECPETAIAQAMARERPEEGRAELTAPSCPASSEVGSVLVGAGSGAPTLVRGRAYLAGPYKGAPLSLLVITPAVVGPFDLGTVVVRNALEVDPLTARVTAVSDPLPSILQGIPLDLRSISIYLGRPEFTLNPTSCDPTSVTGTASSLLGQIATLSDRFQVGGCGGLGFSPSLKVSLSGATGRTGHPALKAVVTFPRGGPSANIARAQVALPHSEFLDQGNLDNVCRRPELSAGTCPSSSIYGHATAWSPLLDRSLEGPVYLAVGFGYKLPALVAELNGQIRVLLVGKIDTDRAKGIRATFGAVPDAPISRFVLRMRGGRKYGLLENSQDICAGPQLLNAYFEAHDGNVALLRPKIHESCGGGGRKRNAPR